MRMSVSLVVVDEVDVMRVPAVEAKDHPPVGADDLTIPAQRNLEDTGTISRKRSLRPLESDRDLVVHRPIWEAVARDHGPRER